MTVDFHDAIYTHVLRAPPTVMAKLLGSDAWIAQDDIPGNAKRVVVVNWYLQSGPMH